MATDPIEEEPPNFYHGRMLFFLVYVSSAITLFTLSDINDILTSSHANNTRLGVSGILLYKDGNLMQLLEGEKDVVHRLYAKIGADARHKDLIVIWDGTESERQYPGWSMAFRDLDRPDSANVVGYSDFLSTPLTSPKLVNDATHCQHLLNLFKTSM